jgi:hypothetical protein
MAIAYVLLLCRLVSSLFRGTKKGFEVEDESADSQDTLTDANYQSFFGMTVESFVRPWEKYVMGMRFSEVCSSPYFLYFAHLSSLNSNSNGD